MPIDFPNSPTAGDIYTVGTKTWQFDGTSWDIVLGPVSIPPNSIDGTHIVDDAIDGTHIADNSIDGTHIADNAVELGTQTTGNYVASISSGTGVTVSGSTSETSSHTISIGQDVAISSLVEFAGLKIATVREPVLVSATAMSATTVDIDAKTNPTVYYTTNATANGTLNVRSTSSETLNSYMSVGDMVTATFMVTNGATPYRPTTFQVDGSAVTPKWQGGSAPSAGNANSIDAYTMTILKTGNAAFTVFASQTRFA